MFTDTLLTWYEEHRRSLPWRGENDPYKIWVSEIILQQTRVQQGWDYYLCFTAQFPDVASLAEASEEQVLRVWQGLGYYSRARNMHFAACQIMNEHEGVFPNHYEDIRRLKGVGDYTAAAIASIAFGLPYPAVDSNVLRIISRIFGVTDDIAQLSTRKKITRICQEYIPDNAPGDFNQACMEFGAVWCTPKNPHCPDCPFVKTCYAFKHNSVNDLPVKRGKIAPKERYFHYLFYINNNSTILEKRTGNDIWRNLYQFPLQETNDNLPLKGKKPTRELKEILTHQIIHAKFYVQKVKELSPRKDQIVVGVDQMVDYPMPKIMVQFLKEAFDS